MFIDVAEVQKRLPEILDKMVSGEEVFITQDDRTVARLIRTPRPRTGPIELGTGKGLMVMHEEDDSHLEGFEEYMR